MKIISGVNSRSDFQAALSSLPNLEKGHAFKKARTFVHTLNLTNVSEWRDYAKSGNLPSNPDKTYSEDGWKGIPDWLGTKKRSQKADK